ncbi:MAG: SDR family oxidoreductase [Myxococcales bacterium]
MWLKNKHAVIYGAGGAIGSAVARVFAREGAQVHLAGRTLSKLEATAHGIREAGGCVSFSQVDALDERAVQAHVDAVVEQGGRIDVTLNATGFMHLQGPSFLSLSYEDFAEPVTTFMRSNFITARAVAKVMARQHSGVILTLSTPGSRMSGSGFLGYGVTCAGIEAFTRILAGELGPSGIRAVCLRPDAIPEALASSYAREVFRRAAEPHGLTPEAMLAARASAGTLLGRFPTLDEVAHAALFAASDHAGALTGAIMNLTCGSLVD